MMRRDATPGGAEACWSPAWTGLLKHAMVVMPTPTTSFRSASSSSSTRVSPNSSFAAGRGPNTNCTPDDETKLVQRNTTYQVETRSKGVALAPRGVRTSASSNPEMGAQRGAFQELLVQRAQAPHLAAPIS